MSEDLAGKIEEMIKKEIDICLKEHVKPYIVGKIERSWPVLLQEK